MGVGDAMLWDSNLARTREFEVANIRQVCIACAYVSALTPSARVHMCARGRILASDPLMAQPSISLQGCEGRSV